MIPNRAAQLSAATMAVGVASTSAHGQAIINMVIALCTPTSLSCEKNQTTAANMQIVGVYQPA